MSDTSRPAESDASSPAASDETSPRAQSDGFTCRWCRVPLVATGPRQRRVDTLYCGKKHRQAAWRFARHRLAAARATEPRRWAAADPPYPGLSKRYYEDHPDYAGEVDHAALLSRLQAYDGWVLCTSRDALPKLLRLCREAGYRVEGDDNADGPVVRVAAWFRGSRPSVAYEPRKAWEPVLYYGSRRRAEPSPDVVDDALVLRARARTSDPARVIGAKPARFAFWLFGLLGAAPCDTLDDLFPGSGGIKRAWELFIEGPAT